MSKRNVVRRIKNIFVGFEVHTEVNMYTYIFWDITPRNPMKMNFKRKGSQKQSFASCLVSVDFWPALLFNTEDG
jgi:hypothetical protein